MYLFSVSGTKPNGLDDEYVIMATNNELCIKSYQHLFPGENEYVWRNMYNRDFIVFKVKKLYDSSDRIKVYVEIIDYRYHDVSKKLVGQGTMYIMKHRMSRPLESDFNLCSIRDFEVIVVNENKFLLPEKQKSYESEFKIYAGLDGFRNFRQSYDIFNEDRDEDDSLSYQSFLRSNRFR